MLEEIVDLATLEDLEHHLGRDNLLRVVDVQIRHSEKQIAHLELLCVAPNAGDLHTLAHQISGAAGSLGLHKLGALALDVEMRARQEDAATLQHLAHALHDLAQRSRQALCELFPELE